MFGFDPRSFLELLPLFILSITLHEWGHAVVADRLGDPTPRAAGRVTLNPLAHLDVMGTLMLAVAHFGWAKPVPTRPHYFKNPRLGSVLVSVAGPGMNLLVAVISLLVLRHWPGLGDVAVGWLERLFGLNLILALFNLLPIPPLDGSHLLEAALPRAWMPAYRQIAPYGMVALLVLFMWPGGFAPLGQLYQAVAHFMTGVL